MTTNDLPMSDEILGAFLAQHALTVGLINQGVVNREALIDQMVDLVATMTPGQRAGYYGRYLEFSIRILEGAQFLE